MKLVFVAVSLIVVLTVDCRSSQPEPDPQHLGIAEDDEWLEPDSQHPDIAEDPEWPESDSQHPDIAEDPEWPESDSQHPNVAEDPQWTDPELPFGPFTTAEPTSDSDTSEPDWPDFEADSEKSDSESRAGCKPNGNCKYDGGYCVTNASQCLGKLKPGGCKGGSSCQCCIPGCPTHFTNPLGNPHCFQNGNPNQCFCLFRGTYRNFTQQQNFCNLLAPQFNSKLAHPLDANFTQSYLVQEYGYLAWPYVNARGSGSSTSNQIWQDSKGYVPKEFYYYFNGGTNYCTLMLSRSDYLRIYPGKPYYATPCSRRLYSTLCELPM